MPNKPDDNGWHLDKKVPLSIIVALVLQTLAGVWFIRGLHDDVEKLKQDVAANQSILERMARLEEKVSAIYDLLRREHANNAGGLQ